MTWTSNGEVIKVKDKVHLVPWNDKFKHDFKIGDISSHDYIRVGSLDIEITINAHKTKVFAY